MLRCISRQSHYVVCVGDVRLSIEPLTTAYCKLVPVSSDSDLLTAVMILGFFIVDPPVHHLNGELQAPDHRCDSSEVTRDIAHSIASNPEVTWDERSVRVIAIQGALGEPENNVARMSD